MENYFSPANTDFENTVEFIKRNEQKKSDEKKKKQKLDINLTDQDVKKLLQDLEDIFEDF